MTSSMQGMDTEQGRQIGGKMGGQAEAISGVFSMVSAAFEAADWLGRDASEFASDMQVFGGHASQAASSLHEQGQVLVRHADAQDQASS